MIVNMAPVSTLIAICIRIIRIHMSFYIRKIIAHRAFFNMPGTGTGDNKGMGLY